MPAGRYDAAIFDGYVISAKRQWGRFIVSLYPANSNSKSKVSYSFDGVRFDPVTLTDFESGPVSVHANHKGTPITEYEREAVLEAFRVWGVEL